MTVKRVRRLGGALPKAVAGVLFGCFFTLAVRALGVGAGEATREVRLLLDTQAALTEQQARLMEQEDALNAALESLAAGEARPEHGALREELTHAQQLAGLWDMVGPGVEVILDDAPKEAIRAEDDINYYIVHDVDVLRVVNLLRSAGAECLSINGERLLSNSRIRCGGPTIRVKDSSFAAPFVIRAIGDPARLSDALTRRSPGDGMSELEILRFFGVRADVTKMDKVEVPRYMGRLNYRYAEGID